MSVVMNAGDRNPFFLEAGAWFTASGACEVLVDRGPTKIRQKIGATEQQVGPFLSDAQILIIATAETTYTVHPAEAWVPASLVPGQIGDLSGITVADYTAFRASTSTAKQIEVTGYLGSAVPSGIAGTFVLDMSGSGADNGGTIIVRSDGARYRRIYSGPAKFAWWVTASGSASAYVESAFESGVPSITVDDDYTLTTAVTATLTNDLTITGVGTFTYDGVASTSTLLLIHAAGHSFKWETPSISGADLVAGLLWVSNNTDTLADCSLIGGDLKNARMASATFNNHAAYIEGTWQTVIIDGNTVTDITRAAGTGVPGSTGTSGINVSSASATRYARKVIHTRNTYRNIIGDDLQAAAGNVDYDGFKCFAPDPTNFPNSDDTVYTYPETSLESWGNTYRNCRGRAIKGQIGFADVHNEKIIRDADYTVSSTSIEIGLQWGVGTVRDIEFIYKDYLVGATVTSPIQGPLGLVSTFQGTWYDEESSSVHISGLRVVNAIKTGVGSNLTYFVQTRAGTVPITKDRPLVSLRDFSMNRGQVDWILDTGYSAGSYGVITMDSIVVPALTHSAVGTGNVNTDFELIANGVVNLDAVKTPSNAVPFVTALSPAGDPINWVGKLSGANNRGFLNTYNVGADFYKHPALNGAALRGPTGANGGALSVQTAFLADDASATFDRRFFTSNSGLILVSANFNGLTTHGVMACGNDDIEVIAAAAGHIFDASTTGANPDTDGKLNLWFTGGALNIKNRLGASHSVTVTFLG